ncbi:MAG: RidA family protein [Bifidobacteriaceae bacterium]|jgi:enamine deaminase RidA (YjgF/YER057c/UK114 family)|nr:RidA family protein [Bifidobacteriaceae bacterium]
MATPVTTPPAQRPEDALTRLGLTLPPTPAPAAAYTTVRIDGRRVYLSGHLPMRDGAVAYTGQVGRGVSEADAYASAQLACLGMIASLKARLGDLSRVAGFVKVTVFINATEEFTAHPAVANGASELLAEVFGPRGAHVRSAIGVASLPFGASTEVEAIALIA